MLDWLIVVSLILFILGFFYKQSAVHEFRINQGDVPVRGKIRAGKEGIAGTAGTAGIAGTAGTVEKEESLYDLWQERVPLVIRGLPRLSLWTRGDVVERSCYDRVPLFQGQTLGGWIQTAPPSVVCPWQGRADQAEALAKGSGISIWCQAHLHSLLGGANMMRLVRYYAWAGGVGLRRTYASWTCIMPTEGDIVVTIFPETMEPYLPPEWRGGFPAEWTRRDTPFAGDIKYMDIVVRTGTCIFLPPHWYVSWVSTGGASHGEAGDVLPMVCTVLYHSPVSWVAEKLAG